MTRDELRESLGFLFDDTQTKELNIYTKSSDGELNMLNIEPGLKNNLLDDFLSTIKQKLIDREYDLQDYSVADRRNNSYYIYDLEEKPEGFDLFDKVLGPNIDYFNIDDNWIGGISFLLVVISSGDHRAILYKDVSGVEKYFAQGGIFMYKFEDRFERVDKDMLRISTNFNMIKIDKTLVILRMESMEKAFNLDQVIKNEAEKGKKRVEGILSDMTKISELCNKDKSFRKQLIATKGSLVFTLKNVDGSSVVSDLDIVNYIKDNEEICGKFDFNADNTKLKIEHFTQAKRLIKILNEDYLKSGLTKVIYDTLSKRQRTEE